MGGPGSGRRKGAKYSKSKKNYWGTKSVKAGKSKIPWYKQKGNAKNLAKLGLRPMTAKESYRNALKD